MTVSVLSSDRPVRPGGTRARVVLTLVTVLGLSSGLAACSDRPPKPSCRAGYVAEWDDDDHEWECERRASSSSGTSGSSGSRRSGRR
ncbi:hypothetical protein [Parafrankia discariae]|uniref:hypothetical protein n=1 Tax=Parafrankia discariae TaxID=365528 RepID=UPI00039CB6D5|nr:hypothetical protein [Parafrankia discariae]